MSQTSENSEEYVASAFSNTVLDGCIVVYEAMYIARMLKWLRIL